ncbi:MAG: hypothetical protein ABEH66_00600 [Halobacteriales archaeon]
MKRRTLIRLLVGIGIGIPLLIEGVTFLGLLEAQLLGGGGPQATPTGTPPDDGVAVDGELLPETAPADTLSTASIAAEGDRTLTLTAFVENTGNASYELRLGAVRTRGGTQVGGSATTGPIQPGESGTVTEQWDLPEGAMPGNVSVTAVVGDERIQRTVPLAPIRVRE